MTERPIKWTIMLGDDGPDFAVEGHGVKAFPELDRVEVVDAAERDALQAEIERLRDLIGEAHAALCALDHPLCPALKAAARGRVVPHD